MSEFCLSFPLGFFAGWTVGTFIAFWQVSRAKKRELELTTDVAIASGRFTPNETRKWDAFRRQDPPDEPPVCAPVE